MKNRFKLVDDKSKKSHDVVFFDCDSGKSVFVGKRVKDLFHSAEVPIQFSTVFPMLDLQEIKSYINEEQEYHYTTLFNAQLFNVHFLNFNLSDTQLLAATFSLDTSYLETDEETINRLSAYNKIAGAFLSQDFLIASYNESFKDIFVNKDKEHYGKLFYHNMINSLYNMNIKTIEEALLKDGFWHDNVILETKEFVYNPYFILIRLGDVDSFDQYYRISYFPLTIGSYANKFKPLNPQMSRVYSKEYFVGIVEKRLNRFDEEKFLIFIDVNDFKAINDEFGHVAGDKSIAIMANIIEESFKGYIVSRYGGDEFTVFLDDNVKLEAIVKAIETIENRVKQEIGHKPRGKKHSISCGISKYPDNGKTLIELIECADKAMYKAKRSDKLFEFSF